MLNTGAPAQSAAGKSARSSAADPCRAFARADTDARPILPPVYTRGASFADCLCKCQGRSITAAASPLRNAQKLAAKPLVQPLPAQTSGDVAWLRLKSAKPASPDALRNHLAQAASFLNIWPALMRCDHMQRPERRRSLRESTLGWWASSDRIGGQSRLDRAALLNGWMHWTAARATYHKKARDPLLPHCKTAYTGDDGHVQAVKPVAVIWPHGERMSGRGSDRRAQREIWPCLDDQAHLLPARLIALMSTPRRPGCLHAPPRARPPQQAISSHCAAKARCS